MALTNDQRCQILAQAGKTALEVIEQHEEQLDLIPMTVVMDNQADSEATSVATLKADFNTLLAALKAAGLMEAGEAGE